MTTPAITYGCPEVPGQTRKSVRPYTFCIVGRSDGKTSAATTRACEAQSAAAKKRWDAKRWHDEQRLSVVIAGQKYLNHNNHMTEAFAESIAVAQEFIRKFPTVEAFLAHEEAEAACYIEKLEASGTGDLEVLQWNMSRRSAEKSITSFAKYHIDVRIVPTTILHVSQPREKATA